MDVSNLISAEEPPRPSTADPQPPHSHQYATRQALAPDDQQNGIVTVTAATFNQSETNYSPSPDAVAHNGPVAPKLVSFMLLLPDSPDQRARLPMRVNIYPHDTTESIITTVKNFYGLYEGFGGRGVSFEDEAGNTLIARYENFQNDMRVYVRVILEHAVSYGGTPGASVLTPQYLCGPSEDQPDSRPAQALTYGQPPSRPASRPDSRTTLKGSPSPHLGYATRSQSASTIQSQLKKAGSKAAKRRCGPSAQDAGADPGSDALNGYSDSEGGHGSVNGSRKTRSEQLASADISLDNIVEGGRRKRAKFESSELPLFVPPQVPVAGSSSSMSPAGRIVRPSGPYSAGPPSQHVFAYPQPLQSPLKQGSGEGASHRGFQPGSTQSTPPAPGHGHHLRNRAQGSYSMARGSAGAPSGHALGILPTPDPTVGSHISEEDAALQLMRLRELSNLSNGTRLSTSTVDDALSGAADVASCDGAASEGEREEEKLSYEQSFQHGEVNQMPLPGSARKRQKLVDGTFPGFAGVELGQDAAATAGDLLRLNGSLAQVTDANVHERVFNSDAKPGASRSSPVKTGKADRTRPPALSKSRTKAAPSPLPQTPISPASLPPQSRKQSITSTSTLNVTAQSLREDEEDLSSKPRCQRCRKSKKGCDRQRPCQRCKDAGIGIDGCVSEDETNGRKGRFGRHMGVVVKKGSRMPVQAADPEPVTDPTETLAGIAAAEKSKKRKR